MDLEELNMSSRITNALQRCNLKTFESILCKPRFELFSALNLSQDDFDDMIKVVSRAALRSTPLTVSEMVAKDPSYDRKTLTKRKLSTGCTILNRFLRGGILPQGITELSGESGSGKTQLCLQLALTSQAPVSHGGLDGAVMYICTEGAFPITRLKQMINGLNPVQPSRTNDSCPTAYTDNIFVHHVEDVKGLQTLLEMKAPVLIESRNVKLIIIDSVAAVFRCEFDGSEAVARAQKLYSLGCALHKLNGQYGTVVVCVNQVTAVVGDTCVHWSHVDKSVSPALGIAWANMITTRIMLSRTPMVATCNKTEFGNKGSAHNQTDSDVIKRRMEMVFSPNLPQSSCYFIVNILGVSGLPDLT